MKLYDGGRAPNPRRVRIYLAEKGIDVPKVPVDLAKMEQKSEALRTLNPLQRLPVLVLDDGTALSETIAISRYFESLHPEPNLFGRDALEIAKIEMWNRRLELALYIPVQAVFRHSHPAMAEYEKPQIAAWAEANKPRVFEFLEIFDRELVNRRFAALDRYTVADITGLVTVDLMKPAKLAVPDGLTNVKRWYEEVSSRPSAKA